MAHHFRDVLAPGSRLRYLWWRASHNHHPITVSLGSHARRDPGSGWRIIMRPEPDRDFGVAYDVFFRGMYAWPDDEPRSAVTHIVDVGANVGYTIVDWARRFPGARIEAFEPHPRHLSLIKAHVALNALGDRVSVHECAAGCAAHDSTLIDAGPCSYVDDPAAASSVDPSSPNASALASFAQAASAPATSPAAKTSPGALTVHVGDFFETIAPSPIDLLKLDAEGAEYPLLADPRFAHLDVHAIVLEWHHRADGLDGGAWCDERLTRLGYRTSILWRDPEQDGGLLWAFHKP